MKTILYLTYYYDPDLSAGAFRNTALSKALSELLDGDTRILLICSRPNRYQNMVDSCPIEEHFGNLSIHRIEVPQHGNHFLKQIISFLYFQKGVYRIIKDFKFDFIFASTSKLFTGYLASKIAKRRGTPYYLDLRDLFSENLAELIQFPLFNRWISKCTYTFFEKPTLVNAAHININSEGFRGSIPASYLGGVSFFPNGIDDIFKGWLQASNIKSNKLIVTYAGNIGEGQGLHKIIPLLAKRLEKSHQFYIVGEGSAKRKLNNELKKKQVTNVELIAPVRRSQLLKYYQNSHYLFLHLNNFRSFEKVLPSKIFEYAGGNVPILAGVSGYAREFLLSEVRLNCFIFKPCDVDEIQNYLELHLYKLELRTEFINKFNREKITYQMAESILKTFKEQNAGK